MMRTEPHPALVHAAWQREPNIASIFQALDASGAETRFVGGCVRDALAGRLRDAGDVDLCTTAPPETMLKAFAAAGLRAIATGIQHGTVTVIADGRPIEVTTLRIDVATDGRRAEVAFTDDFEADAARRDFTFNAMSADRKGGLFDPFGGLEDLEAGRVRFVGEAARRIEEDYLRVLRFFRFFAAFGREPPGARTLQALEVAVPNLGGLSGERMQTEMFKLLALPNPVAALGLMQRTGVQDAVLASEIDTANLERLLDLEPAPDPVRRLASLLRTASDPTLTARSVAARWRLSTTDKDRLLRLVSRTPTIADGDDALKVAIHRFGRATVRDRLLLAAAESAPSRASLGAVDSIKVPPFPLMGRDLLALGAEPGPEVGRVLDLVEAWWLERGLEPDRQACLAEAAKHVRANNA